MWARPDDQAAALLIAASKRPLTDLERALEAVALLGIALSIALPLIVWGRLPEHVPTHFNAAGQPDAFGTKAALFEVVWVQIAMWAVFALVMPLLRQISPRYWNIPARVTVDNAERAAIAMRRAMAILKVMTVWIFTLVQFQSVSVALGNAAGQPVWFLPLMLMMPVASLVVIALSFAQLYQRS